MERVFCVEGPSGLRPPPRPQAGVFRKLGHFRSKLLGLLGSCRPWSMEDFVSSYSGAKQEIVRAAAESLTTRPISRDDAQLKTFVKAEKLNLSAKADPAPRVIQPRTPRYNCVVGPYLKAHEHNIYRAIAGVWGGPTVMKGMNAREVATELRSMWDSFGNTCAVGLDASRFDQHVSKQALEWEHSVYNSMFHDSDLKKALRWQIDNRGVAYTAEGRVKYRVEGCRMSGDMNTSLGNCLLMSAMVWQYAQERHVPCRLANNGDDCVVFMSAGHAKQFREGLKEWFNTMGFTMKVEDTVFDFERVEFCQTRPVISGGSWVMCRNPHVCMDKDAVCLHPQTNPFDKWLGAVGTAGLALASGVPILQAYYTKLKSCGESTCLKDGSGMAYLAARMESVSTPITTEARVSFFKAFGIPPWVQLAVEAEILAAEVDVSLGVIPTSPRGHSTLLQLTDQW